MKQVRNNLGLLIEPFSGKWVTLTPDKKTVLSVSRNMKTALSQAHDKGEPQPFLIKSPDAHTAAVFY